MRRILMMFILIALVLTFVGCSKNDTTPNQDYVATGSSNNSIQELNQAIFPMEVTDAFGNKIEISNEPMRIVSIAPSATEIVFALGLGDRLVGVSNYCYYPDEANSITKIGDSFGVNIELIVELEPDLVIDFNNWSSLALSSLVDFGIPVYQTSGDDFEDILDNIKGISIALGKKDLGVDLARSLEDSLKAMLDKIPNDRKGSKVFYEVWYEPLMTAGKNTFINELFLLVGADPVGNSVEGYVNYGLEDLVIANPDYYFSSEFNLISSPLETRDGYESINAVIKGNVFSLNDDYISRPGPRVILGIEEILKALYPDIFD